MGNYRIHLQPNDFCILFFKIKALNVEHFCSCVFSLVISEKHRPGSFKLGPADLPLRHPCLPMKSCMIHRDLLRPVVQILFCSSLAAVFGMEESVFPACSGDHCHGTERLCQSTHVARCLLILPDPCPPPVGPRQELHAVFSALPLRLKPRVLPDSLRLSHPTSEDP